jgi:DNA-binding XRE family transcriptional regulator
MGKLGRAQSPARRLAAQTVRQLREAAGLTQERCALEHGVGLRTLRDIEAGKCRMTALELVIGLRLAAAGPSREELRHAPAIALVVDGAVSRLTETNTLTGAPAPTSPVSPDVETAAAAAELAPRGKAAA